VFQLDLPGCRNSMQAEILTAIEAVEAARRRFPQHEVMLHTDLKHLGAMMANAMRGPAARLRWLLKQCGGRFATDARNHPEYHLCHDRAQIQAGCRGKFHPLRVRVGC
jgi:hypothetical protein